jgi:spermidine synthase
LAADDPPTGWPDPKAAKPTKKRATALLSMVLVIATAGLVYELSMAAVASYLLGDSITQFSTVIGVYLSAMGIGAWLSRFAERRLAVLFVDVELCTALVGGLCAPGLLLAYGYTNAFRFILYATVLAVGILVGLELPLLMRILRRELEFKELVARALTFDYAGALLGSLGFSLLLAPRIGLVHTSLACGLLNAIVGFLSTYVLDRGPDAEREGLARARVRAVVVCVLLVVGLGLGKRLVDLSERASYAGGVIHAESSPYQRIVLTERQGAVELYLNGNLQFSTQDEHRYHEALVHPSFAVAARHARVLIGGGGDGLAAREVLRWPDVSHVTLVDLDPHMTELGLRHPRLVQQNQRSLSDPRVEIVNADAFVWMSESKQTFDVIILDFPDPSTFSVGKLYSSEMYQRVRARLAPDGALVVQSASPLFARRSFWCIVHTVQSAGLEVLPYRVFVPSFGEWGFTLASPRPFPRPTTLPRATLAYLDEPTLASLFQIAPDMGELGNEVNHLDNQALVSMYLGEWDRWN